VENESEIAKNGQIAAAIQAVAKKESQYFDFYTKYT